MLKNKIFVYIILTILFVNIVIAEKYFVLDVNYNNILGSVTFNSNSLKEIDKTIKHTDKSGFLIKAISFDNSEIEKFYYIMSESKNYFIYVPYHKNAAKIIVYDPSNSIIMEIDVSSFADTCGNNICEPYESYESCTRDCTSGAKDDFCDEVKDGICDPDCTPKTDADCSDKKIDENNEATVVANNIQNQNNIVENVVNEEEEKKLNYLVWILPAFAIIIFVLLFLLYKKIRKNQIVSSLKQYISENIRKGFSLQQIKDTLYREGYNEKEIDKAIKTI